MPENKEQKATPITAETKKSTEPTKAEESKSPTGQKAKTTQEVTKPTGEAKPAPATEAKKPLEAPKPAPSTQAPTPPVDQKKVTKAPKSPGDAKAPAAAEAKKPMEPAKAEEVKSPAGQKAKATQETSKPTVEPKTVSGGESKKSPEPSKAAPATEAKKPSEAPKPAPSTQTVTSPVDQKKVTEAPKSPGDAKAPVTAEAKKPTEPAKTEEAKSPAGQKAKTTQEVTKPTRESKAAPAAEPKKPSEAPKPAPSTQATTRLVDQQKPPEVPKSPGDAKTPAAAEAKKPAETPKLPSDAKAPVIPAVPDTAKQTLPKGMRITQVIADRLDKPDEKALKDLPVPKEGEGISARLHPDYFFEFLDHPFSINREVADYKDLFDSIKANGINEPVKARPREGGGLELLSGHRRHDVAKQLGYAVTWDLGDGDRETTSQTYGQALVLPDTPSKTGHTFIGWFTAESGGTQVTDSTVYTTAGPATYYARWEAQKYTITWDLGDGRTETTSQTYGEKLVLPTQPLKDGYTFLGWFTAESGGTQVTGDEIYTGTGPATYYAHWELLPVFSVTVPMSLALTVSERGEVYAATGAAIVNHSTAPVRVSEVTVSAVNGWTLVPYDTDMAGEKVDSRLLGFALNGAETSARGGSEALALTGDWTIPLDGSLPLTYDAVVSALSQPVDERVVSIVFVLEWA